MITNQKGKTPPAETRLTIRNENFLRSMVILKSTIKSRLKESWWTGDYGNSRRLGNRRLSLSQVGLKQTSNWKEMCSIRQRWKWMRMQGICTETQFFNTKRGILLGPGVSAGKHKRVRERKRWRSRAGIDLHGVGLKCLRGEFSIIWG